MLLPTNFCFAVVKLCVLLEIYSMHDCAVLQLWDLVMALLQDISLGKNKLKHVRTTCTTADGKQVRLPKGHAVCCHY